MAIEAQALSAQVAGRSIWRTGAIVLGLLFIVLSFGRARIEGDGMEYVMMTHDFYRHATPELRPSDIADIAALPPAKVRAAGLAQKQLIAVPDQVRHAHAISLGFADGKSWGMQAIHFWMYSLLAAPFYALTAALGLNPALAFAALNLVVVGLAARCILRWYPKAGAAELTLLVLLGPVLYARWTGPEVFSACCSLVAVLAMLRRDMALAAFLAGLGATQNPSIAGLIVAAGAFQVLFALRPAWAPVPKPIKPRLRNAVLVVLGIALAAAPYVYNEIVFGMPSIIAANYTNPALVSWERFTSLFFDLNQGLVVGFPGLVLALVLLAAWLRGPSRLRWLAWAACALALTVGLAIPTLAAVNWNNGYVVIMRYAYWVAMPLAAVAIAGLTLLRPGQRRAAVVAVLVCQLLAMWQGGWPTGTSCIKHMRLADWVLDHAPALYNPDVEVFFERERHHEGDVPIDAVVVHRSAAGPTKLMRYWANTADSAGICAAGQTLLSPAGSAGAGWEYFNAPFRCGVAAQPVADWTFGTAQANQAAMLAHGWSKSEPTGVWTDGPRATLVIPLPKGAAFRRLGLVGSYFRPKTLTDVTINGVHLGRVQLDGAPIALPPAAVNAPALTIELVHDHPVSPASLGMSTDARQLGFYLQRVHLDGEPAH